MQKMALAQIPCQVQAPRQLQTLALQEYPSGLLRHNVFTDLTNPKLFNTIKVWRFDLATILGRQIYGTIQQYTPQSHKDSTEAMGIIEKRMIDQRFEHSQLLRTSVMFSLMLTFGLFDDKKDQDESDPTLQLLLALADSIMAQQYTQNYGVDEKNKKLRNGNEDILNHLREYWDYTIKNLIYNMQIEEEKKQEIESIYKRMNYDFVQRGQVFDGLLLRETHYESSLNSLLYHEVDIDILLTLSKNEQGELFKLAADPDRFDSDLWQRSSTCIKVSGISAYVVKDTLQQLISRYPDRKLVKDRFSDGLIFDLRYRYIDVEYWKGLIDIINAFAPTEDIKVVGALQKLFEHYGYGAQARNDLSDYLPEEDFVRNNLSKDENDIHADHRNKMITEIIYSLYKLIGEGEDSLIRLEIQSIVKYLGCDPDVFTLPLELESKSLKELFDLPPAVLKEYFMKTGLFLWMVQKTVSTRTTGVADVQECIEELKIKKETNLEENEQSVIEQKLIGMQLIAILTEPAKTPENSIFKQLEKVLNTGRKEIYKLLLAYSRYRSHTIPNIVEFGALVQVSPFSGYSRIILENMHRPVVEQLKIFLPKIKEISDAMVENLESDDYLFSYNEYVIPFSAHKRINDLKEIDFKSFFHSKLSRVEECLDKVVDEELRKMLRELYAYMLVLATNGPSPYISTDDLTFLLDEIHSHSSFRGPLVFGGLTYFYEEELFRTALPEEYIISTIRKFLDVLYNGVQDNSNGISDFPLEAQEYIMYCRMLIKGDKFISTQDIPLSEVIYIKSPIFDVIDAIRLYTNENGSALIQNDDVEVNLETQCAHIYNVLCQLPDIVDLDNITEILNRIHRVRKEGNMTKQEIKLLDLLEKYFNSDGYGKKELMRDFIGWVACYPTLMMVISTMAVNHPKYVEYLTSLVYTRKKEEKDPKQIVFLLECMSNYLKNNDVIKGELYTRHINALSLLILLYSNEEYVEDPLQVFLNWSYPISSENEDGQQIYVQKALVDNYDQLIDWRNPGYPGAVEEMLKLVINIVQPIGNAQILDIGCGPGNILEKVRQVLQDSESTYTITAVDKSQPMVEICKARFEGDEKVIVKCKDILVMQQTNKYDLITCNLMLHNLSIYNGLKQKAVRKMYDMLQPGGTLLLTDMYYNDKRVEGRKICIDSFASHKEEIEKMAEEHGTTYQAILDYIVEKVLGFDINGGGLISWKDFKMLLKEAGFVDIKILHKTNTDILVISAKKPG